MKTQQLSTAIYSSTEIELNYKRPLFNSMISITSPEDAVQSLRRFYNSNLIDLKEMFWLITMTNANRLISICEITSGSTKAVQVSPKLIFQLALKVNAVSIIVAHNHPSGKLKVSQSDKEQTQKLKTLAEVMEITLLDHLIITSEAFLSFAYEREL